MQRFGYRAAVRWLSENDTCGREWVGIEDEPPPDAACLIVEMFGVDWSRFERDIARELARVRKRRNPT
ncbi:hypothetical protein ACLBWX_18375 [Methylobacterium sp. M6A4_1b]